MAGRKGIAKDGENTRFSRENQPDNPGRKPSILKKYIKRYNISKGDVESIIECILFDHTFGKIGEIRSDKERLNKLPVFVGYFINALGKAADKGDLRWLENYLDRKFGKAAALVEVLNVSEEAAARLAQLFQEETAQPCEPAHILPKKTLQDHDET